MAFSGGVGAVLAGASINAGLTGGITAAALRATAESARVLPPVPNRLVNEAITEQAPLVGKALNFRTVSIAERLQQPVAPEAKDFGVSNKADVLRMLTELPINIDDIELPGFYRYSGTTLDKTPYTVGGRTLERPIERRFNVLDVAGRDLIAEVLQEKHDLDPTDGDEGAFFAAAVRSLDNVVAILRLIEGRILAYRLVIDTCREALGRINEQRAAVQARMFVIATGLAEARQDVAVARALLDEERRRVGAVNYRRDDIVRNHVPYFAFRRPRSVDLSIEAPGRRLDPGITDAPLPACMAEAVDIPPGLGQMVSHMRDAPASWFRHVHPLIDKLNQPHVLLQSLQYAKVRAIVHHEAILALRASGPDVAGEHDSIRRVLSARQDVASRSRALTAQLDVGELTALSWANVRERARETLSVGDLADGAHGRAEVARGAAEELDRIAHVGACLYNRFGEVRPAIRLGWAEQLGQYDEAVSLQNLSALPQWGDIDLLDRREMQGLTDWLFSRIDAGNADAHALMSDLIRLCILIASHAPVDRILAAKIEQPTTVQPGARLHLAVDTVTARIGMHVVVYGPSGAGASSNVVARGVVEDLGGGRAAARIVETIGAAVNLATSSVVHLVSPASTLAALTPKPAATPPQPGAGAQSFGNLFGIHW
jgi:hypothetical protein